MSKEQNSRDTFYLGVFDGILLFDTDNNMDMAEISVSVSDTQKSSIVRDMYKQEGKCRKVAQWCDITDLSIYSFNRVKTDEEMVYEGKRKEI